MNMDMTIEHELHVLILLHASHLRTDYDFKHILFKYTTLNKARNNLIIPLKKVGPYRITNSF